MSSLSLSEQIRLARIGKGWSQRELGRKAGMPQAHISRIESGAVDVRLSTLMEIARLVDLEVLLAPKKAIPAVLSLVRQAGNLQDARVARGAMARLHAVLEEFEGFAAAYPRSERLEALTTSAAEIAAFVGPRDADELEAALAPLRHTDGSAPIDPARLAEAAQRLRALRDRLARPAAARPAYSLEDED
ncbi:helix-turn-helix transcriptional regulator [Caulobacter segnis]|uniref:helix-turn-helix domain-containing protein n=1 Tax=Caulobacter segnis TaxID=88688 RepID=UPI00240F2A0F|nr:helix-turn-helix transcriptional regulator [Caulobacter segnis]MDG2520635.1 helix-turn-helix transcriptional regulator [Caulobacter segnis]